MNNNIIAILVTYNRKALLKESIDALLKQTCREFDILIVDNASTDGTYEFIQDYVKNDRVLYYNTMKNLGGAGGFQYGIKLAVEKKYDDIWLMDDDTIPNSSALEELLNAKRITDGKFGFLCSDVKWIDGSTCSMNVPNISKSWSSDSKWLEEGLLKVDQCSFVSCFFSVETVKKVGLPIKEFFVWGDDAEYTKRISDYLPSYFVAKSKVIHKMASNIPTDISEDSAERLFRYKFLYRNMYYVVRTHGTKLDRLLFWYGIFLDAKKILKSKQKGKKDKIFMIFCSLKEGRKFHPQIEYID